MLQLRVFGSPVATATLAERLDAIPGSHHVIQTANEHSATAPVTANLVDDAVDRALEQVNRLGVPAGDVALLRLDTIGPSVARRPPASVVWSDLLSQAGPNSRPLARYIVFMASAGIVAGFGVT